MCVPGPRCRTGLCFQAATFDPEGHLERDIPPLPDFCVLVSAGSEAQAICRPDEVGQCVRQAGIEGSECMRLGRGRWNPSHISTTTD